jgi:D-lyxose ketol-isomerase
MEEVMKRSMVFGVAMVFVMSMYGATIFALSEHTFSGKIMMVDPKLKIMVVKDNNNDEMTFHVRKQTEILVSGEPKLFGELRKGEDVTITYAMAGDQHVAKNAKVKSSSSQS